MKKTFSFVCQSHRPELNARLVGSIAQEIMMREQIVRKERELRAAQAAYSAVKKARYQRDEGSPNSVSSSGQSATTSGSQISDRK